MGDNIQLLLYETVLEDVITAVECLPYIMHREPENHLAYVEVGIEI